MKALLFFIILIPIACGAQATEGDHADTLLQSPHVIQYKGVSIEIEGWELMEPPRLVLKPTDEGRIVFNIELDEKGDVIRCIKESSTVSADAERACASVLKDCGL